MTLKVAADAAGCSESLLSKIENSKACPSLPMLNRLVKSLDISMGWVFDDDDPEPIIFRAAQRTTTSAACAIAVDCVIPASDRHALRCNIFHIEAGAGSDGKRQPSGEEVACLLDGQIELLLAGRPHRLNAGDAFAFRSDQPHSYRNTGSTRASVFRVNISSSS